MTHATIQLDIPLVYMETTIPENMTIGEYARSRPRVTRWQRLKRLAGAAA
jgi:hypothetical protein